MEGLFGEDFKINIDTSRSKVKDLVKKTKPVLTEEEETKKLLKSKKLSLEERLNIITEKVIKILGKQRQNTVVIRSLSDFSAYIDKAIKVGRIAVDTETNNSLDPVTCKLMGLCLYVPGEKQAYIPINHINNLTGELLDNQLTEKDCNDQLQRLLDNNVFIVMHNGKFDYEVIKCTCDIAVKPNWDTMICARLLDENEKAGLKEQYINKIDPSQAKYDIESLFTNISYAQVDPEIFALYAATDSMMTDKLYLYQEPIMSAAENKRLLWVFENIEMPIVIVTAEMELRGVCIDVEFGAKLKSKYELILTDLDKQIEQVLEDIKPEITDWKLKPEANAVTRVYVPKKTKMTQEKIEATYPLIDENGDRYKEGKSRVSQLKDPINLSSPPQLAILFYDILQCPPASKNKPRATGSTELKQLMEVLAKYEVKKDDEDEELLDTDDTEDETENEQSELNSEAIEAIEEETPEQHLLKARVAAAGLCKLILKRRGLVKLITTYIDTIPTLAKHWPDGRIRFHLNSMGTDTGRYSSGGKIKYIDPDTNEPVTVSGINIQNIPSRGAGKITRCLFKAKVEEKSIEEHDNCYEVNEISEVETPVGWKFCKDLKIGDYICTDEGQDIIINIEQRDKTYYIYAEKYHLGL